VASGGPPSQGKAPTDKLTSFTTIELYLFTDKLVDNNYFVVFTDGTTTNKDANFTDDSTSFTVLHSVPQCPEHKLVESEGFVHKDETFARDAPGRSVHLC